MVQRLLVGVIVGFGLVYLLLVVGLVVARRRNPQAIRLREALRLLPDLVVLLRRLASDRDVPRGVRVRLVLLVAYLVSPIDLIPDFVPVIGYADDAIIVAVALRSVARTAGDEAIDRNWPGTPQGLVLVRRLAGLST